jgi:SAM-dependent methyltransferase
MSAVFIILILVLALLAGLSVSPSRHKKLDFIVRDLQNLLKTARPDQVYAINENIAFFRAIKTIPGYVAWAATRRRNIVAKNLLEIADFPLPRWEKELYDDLAHVERKNFPGLTKPLRNLLVAYIKSKKSAILLDLGCGGMEAERQAIVELRKQGVQHSTAYVGIDLAPQAWDSIQDNFNELKGEVDIKKISDISDIERYKTDKPTILFHCGNALEIASLHGHRFDLIISSRFRHHLDGAGKKLLDHISLNIANELIEYDDYRSAFSWIAPLLTAWYRPILLNGAIFSQIRQPWKHDLRATKSDTGKLTVKIFSPPGSYAKIALKKK